MSNDTIILANLIILIYLAIHFTRKLNRLEDEINQLNLIIVALIDLNKNKSIHIVKD